MLSKTTKSKKLKAQMRKLTHATTVFMDIYIILILGYGALTIANLLPAIDTARKMLAASLALFCIVRLVIAFSRAHSDLLEQ